MKKNEGQVVVEYMLMLVVVVSIVTSLFTIIKRKFIGDPRKCELAINKTKLACKLNFILNPSGASSGDKPFQYYPFKK
jgi:uncharacterized protein (UPF0333 family)